MKQRRPVTFKAEADLCSAFIAWAKASGARCYAEWAGWDILLVLPSGHQIGIQAKLRLNDAVICQAYPRIENVDLPGPDFRAVLVPDSTPERGFIAHALGLLVFEPKFEYPKDIHWGQKTEFRGDFHPSLDMDQRWPGWSVASRHELPATDTDSVAGSPCPVTLTPWKLSALAVIAELEVVGQIETRVMRSFGIAPSRWTQGRWIKPSGVRGFWIRGEDCPAFDKQHPSAYAAALEKARLRNGPLALLNVPRETS